MLNFTSIMASPLQRANIPLQGLDRCALTVGAISGPNSQPGARGGRYSNFLYHDILRKNIAILLYITIFLYFHDSKVHVIILNKEIPHMDDFYLKLKSKYGPLVEYKLGVRPICQHNFGNNRMLKEPRITLE